MPADLEEGDEGEFSYEYPTKKGTHVFIIDEHRLKGSFVTREDSEGPLRWRRDSTAKSLVNCLYPNALSHINIRYSQVNRYSSANGWVFNGFHIPHSYCVDYGPCIVRFEDLVTGSTVIGISTRTIANTVADLMTYKTDSSGDRDSVLFWSRLFFPESVFGSVEAFDFEDCDEQVWAIVI